MAVLIKTAPPGPVARPAKTIPNVTIRLRMGKRCLRHGLRLGWRTEWPEPFPVTVTKINKQKFNDQERTAA